MAGFLGLGGGGESFFLDADDAKTMGDIEYMRTPKKVKRTFAKTKGWGDVGASEKSITAYDVTGDSVEANTSSSYNYSTPTYTATATPTDTAPEPVAETPAPAPVETAAPVEAAATEAPAETAAAPVAETPAPAPAAPVSDGMDMFRAMARKIR